MFEHHMAYFMDVGVPHAIWLFVDLELCECAMCQHCECVMCYQTIDQMFNLHSCNLVKMVIKFLEDIMPN
jgi:hypothetical protein